MQFLHEMVDMVLKKLDLLVFLDQHLSKLVGIIHQWTVRAGCLTPYLFHRTLILNARKSTNMANDRIHYLSIHTEYECSFHITATAVQST